MFIFKGILRGAESAPYSINTNGAVKNGVTNDVLVEDTGASLKKLMKVVKLPIGLTLKEKVGDVISWIVDIRDFGKGLVIVYISEYHEEIKK